MTFSMEPTKTNFVEDISRVSPELALVDPELASRLRARVPRKLPGHRPPLPVLRLSLGAGQVAEHGQNASPT